MRALLFLAVLLLCAPPALAAQKWNVSQTQSVLGFKGKAMGKEFTGLIARYAPEIYFDPADLPHSRAEVKVDLSTLDSGDRDRDAAAAGPEWLDITKFPEAVFSADRFEKTGEGKFRAEGTLTIKGISAPLAVDFTFAPSGKADVRQAKVEGIARLDRRKWSLGAGQWADEKVIANEIAVTFTFIAYEDKNK